MSLNTKTRFLVMNRTNQVIKPRDEKLGGALDAGALKAAGEIPKKHSPSFINEGTARDFAEALANKYPKQRFYVAEVVAGCVKDEVSWSEAAPVELADTQAEGIDDTDATDNE